MSTVRPARIHLFGVAVGLVEREDEDSAAFRSRSRTCDRCRPAERHGTEGQLLPLQDSNVRGQRRIRHDFAMSTADGAVQISMRYCAPRDNNMAFKVWKMM